MPGEELIDGSVPGLRVIRTAAGLSWGLSVRVRGARRWIRVGVGIGLAEARRRGERLRQDIADGKDPAEERAAEKQRQRDAVKGLGTLRGVMDAASMDCKQYFDNGASGSMVPFTLSAFEMRSISHARIASKSLAMLSPNSPRTNFQHCGKRWFSLWEQV